MGRNAALLKERAQRAPQEPAEAARDDVVPRGSVEPGNDAAPLALDGQTRAKFVLFAIPASERVEDGPVMRGLLETPQGRINVAGWKRVARDSGNEYLSLKVGNTRPREEGAPRGRPDEWLIGPFYGRLFKEVTMRRGIGSTRYFGFIENAEKIGEDATTQQGLYKTHWQLHVKARPSVSSDGLTPYISGTASPAGARAVEEGETKLPF
jgi:hypothetical protein